MIGPELVLPIFLHLWVHTSLTLIVDIWEHAAQDDFAKISPYHSSAVGCYRQRPSL